LVRWFGPLKDLLLVPSIGFQSAFLGLLALLLDFLALVRNGMILLNRIHAFESGVGFFGSLERLVLLFEVSGFEIRHL
jgi:hypothetical protein